MGNVCIIYMLYELCVAHYKYCNNNSSFFLSTFTGKSSRFRSWCSCKTRGSARTSLRGRSHRFIWPRGAASYVIVHHGSFIAWFFNFFAQSGNPHLLHIWSRSHEKHFFGISWVISHFTRSHTFAPGITASTGRDHGNVLFMKFGPATFALKGRRGSESSP